MNTTSYQDFHITDGVLYAYTGRDESILVPEHVHTIGEGAFKACVSLKQVVLPKHLRHILSGAFKGCRKLEHIHIPEGVCTIGDYAFHRCHALTSIALPPSVEELGDCVFLYCDSLTWAEIPGVKRMGKQVFVNDVLLQKITISPKLQEKCICDVFTGCSRLSQISFFQGESFAFPNAVEAIAGEIKLPSLARAIAADVLRMMELDGRRLVKFLTNLKHVEIPEGIEQIGKSCFFDKRGILSVSLPASLREIESRAFRNCISLETVRFQKDSVIIHEDAFKNCSLLKEVHTSDGTIYRMEGISDVSALPDTYPDTVDAADGWTAGVSSSSADNAPTPAQTLVQTIHQQVLGNFCISGSILLKYLGDESRVLVPDGITRIAEEAFAGKESIDRVILPDSVTEIGAGAFRDCLLLQTIPFPDNLCRIGEGAFEHCVKLLRVILPAKLVQVEAKTFKHCSKLKEIVMDEELRAIGKQAFYGCASLKEIRFPQNLRSIGMMAFYRCTGLREVCLSPEIHHVGNLAFAGSGVRKARLCGSGKGYGSELFFGCLSLKTMVLENGVRHLSDKLAWGCTALKKVVWADSSSLSSFVSVGKNVWENTPFLDDWVNEYAGDERKTDGEILWMEKKADSEIPEIERKTDNEIPEIERKTDSGIPGVELKADEEIFWDGRNLSGEVYLPKQTRIIAGGTFYGNEHLTAVYIPDGVTWIGSAAFKGCSSLRYVVWPSGIKTVEAEVFSGCICLEKIDTSVHWLFIRERAFYGCHHLGYILLDKVKTIGKEAFSGCHALADTFRLALQKEMKHLTWVGERALENIGVDVVGNILISGQNVIGEMQPSPLLPSDTADSFRIPEGIRIIAPYAFSGNQNITHLVLPESLQFIGEGAFWGCSGLVQVDFPSHLNSIGDRAFEKCTALGKICLHARHIGTRAFACCTALKTAEIAGILRLENRLFEHCTSLEKCSFSDPVRVQNIGDFCFSGCRNLDSFDLSSVLEIGCYAFQNCDSLGSISLNDNTVLRPHAFEDCGGLTRVLLTGKQGILVLYEYALSGCTALTQVSHGEKTWILKRYRDRLSGQLPETVRLLFHSALSCFTVEQEEILCGYRGAGRVVHIPYGIRRIEAEVFRDVLMLEQITIPETVDYIGARAFHGTAWMEKMRRKSPLVTVNAMLLDGSLCEGEVTIPEDIRLICGWAFAGGMGITRINFLSGRVKVEAFAFRNCIYLREMQLADGTCIRFEGIADRGKKLPPLALQAVTDSLNCFKTDEHNQLIECTGNISCLLIAHGITAIGDRVFLDGNLLTEVTLPATVTSIGKSAFSGCKWLRVVKQAQSVKYIGERAFWGCGVLEKIELSEKLAIIGARAFENCTSLKEILLPEGLEEIPDRAFFRCHSLERILLPSTLKRIGKETFAFCKNLDMPALPQGVLVENGAFTGINKAKDLLE